MASKAEKRLSDMKVRMWSAVFDKCDKNHDGNLTWEEMKPVFRKVFGDGNPDNLLAKMDRNRDGKIEKREFVQAMLTFSLSKRSAVQAYFYAMDEDNSACLDIEEFKEAMQNLGITDPRLVENLRRIADNDNNKKISVCEFMSFFNKFTAH